MFFKLLTLLPLFTRILHVDAQCNTAGFVPCLVPGASVPAAPSVVTFTDSTDLWSSLQAGIAGFNPGLKGRDLQYSPNLDAYNTLERRQNSLCCRPSPVECLYADNVPFCYTPQTTRLFFSDGSYAFASNQPFYGSDGTFIDFATGLYQYPNGTQVHFTPEGSSASGSASAPGPSSTSSTGTSGSNHPSTSASAGFNSVADNAPLGLVLIGLGLFIRLG